VVNKVILDVALYYNSTYNNRLVRIRLTWKLAIPMSSRALSLSPYFGCTFYGRFSSGQPAQSSGYKWSWEGVPEVVYITMKVPRKALAALASLWRARIGKPIAYCLIQSPYDLEAG